MINVCTHTLVARKVCVDIKSRLVLINAKLLCKARGDMPYTIPKLQPRAVARFLAHLVYGNAKGSKR